MNPELSARMKRLFSNLKKSPPAPSPEPTASPAHPPNPSILNVGHKTVLQPKYVLPPLPHPCPYEHIALLPTPQGLLLRPHFADETPSKTHVRITWGKDGKVEELEGDGESTTANWADSAVVYGILGILTLFSGTDLTFYLFLHVQTWATGVSVIPLVESRANAALQTLARVRTASTTRYPTQFDELSDSGIDPPDEEASNSNKNLSSPHVKFATEDQIKMMTPLTSHGFEPTLDDDSTPSSPSSSVASTPSSDISLNTNNVARALADKLSFWSRLSKRASRPTFSAAEQGLAHDEEALRSLMRGESPTDLNEMMENGVKEPAEVLDSILQATAPPPPTVEEKHGELEEKIIRECVREFTRGGMYFSYNFDITRSLQHKQEQIAKNKKQNALLADLNALDDSQKLSPLGDRIDLLAEPFPTLPLWRRVDRQFWWNEWLSKPFIDAGLHSYVLPVMQGFYQIASFAVPREAVASEEGDFAIADYILISRRSRDRAGLRYQRRGIDDGANVANFVETEAIMRVEREGFVNVFSHVQIRGSIPLFWNQTGYGLKPPPVLSPDRTRGQNLDAIRRHFSKTVMQYGPLTIVNLAEQHGKEALITNAYREYVTEMKMPDVQYNEYDFHLETRGMKYENISKLIENMERIFEGQGYLWVSNNSMMSQQKGVFRVNCIDCLDRTNVVESAFARYVLNRQLGAVALLNPMTEGKTETDVVFNDIWANNGDAISKEYAGTSALKGDFTRTGKRDLTGLLNDGVNSLARMYTSTFGDWFSQAVIDFMLGNRTLAVFSEFLLKLQSTDPSDLIRISKIRAEAIATSVARVLEDGERLLSGWTLLSPVDFNTKIGNRFEEKILLLSVRALYIISYDYTLEKVKMYTRVPLGDIISIRKGAYILSPLEEASRDPLQNAGFIVTWRNTHQDTRVTSYSIRNSLDLTSPPASPRAPTSPKSPRLPSRRNTALSRILSNAAAPAINDDVTFATFKVLPIDPARNRRDNGSFIEPADELTGASNCKEIVDLMVQAIQKACMDVGNGHEDFVIEEDVVSLAEAQRMTSVYSKMEYGVKRLLWLGG
ncbi:unnamed protein product [Somion occarium]|uniref:SacI homology domain-containing protein n=1 Tax=Somion occarium TaxID=3059160 RepID=A0ABP1DB88_9APHY